MATAAVIGEALAVEGYALAGAVVYPADSPEAATAAFDALPPGTALVILTTNAAASLAGKLDRRADILTVVMKP
jgi:vacuolar-type H+-ATPase subunit F/Vma7